MPSCKTIIYGLLDPRTDEIRYIGRSSSGMKRARHHLKKSVLTKDRTHKGHWLRKLGAAPLVLVLEEVQDGNLAEREVWWISFGRSEGWPLTNETDGGEGGHTGRKFTPEHRARISAANKGRKLTEEQRNKISAAARQRPVDRERLVKMWAASARKRDPLNRILKDVAGGATLESRFRAFFNA
jgi:hypothetical protein